MKHEKTIKNSEFIESRYYLIEWDSTQLFETFLKEIQDVCFDIKFFRGGIGQVYLSIRGIFDGGDILNIKTFDDVLHDFRKKGVRLLKEYERKPTPQRYWRGEWVVFKES